MLAVKSGELRKRNVPKKTRATRRDEQEEESVAGDAGAENGLPPETEHGQNSPRNDASLKAEPIVTAEQNHCVSNRLTHISRLDLILPELLHQVETTDHCTPFSPSMNIRTVSRHVILIITCDSAVIRCLELVLIALVLCIDGG